MSALSRISDLIAAQAQAQRARLRLAAAAGAVVSVSAVCLLGLSGWFITGAAFAGLAGATLVLAQVGTFAEQMTAGRGFVAIAIVVLGRWHPFGVAIAAVVLIGGPELLRNLGFMRAVFGEGFDPNEYRLLIFGVGMVAMMVWRPRGLIATREPSVILKERKAIAGALVKEGHG